MHNISIIQNVFFLTLTWMLMSCCLSFLIMLISPPLQTEPSQQPFDGLPLNVWARDGQDPNDSTRRFMCVWVKCLSDCRCHWNWWVNELLLWMNSNNLDDSNIQDCGKDDTGISSNMGFIEFNAVYIFYSAILIHTDTPLDIAISDSSDPQRCTRDRTFWKYPLALSVFLSSSSPMILKNKNTMKDDAHQRKDGV